MAIVGVVGRPGGGKTVCLTWLGCSALARGLRVWSNYAVDRESLRWWLYFRGGLRSHEELEEAVDRWRYWEGPDELEGVREGVLLFDEAHLWAFSRRWQELPFELVWWWSQSRKRRVDVYFSTQRWESVDAQLRDLAAEVWHARRRLAWWWVYVVTDPQGRDRRLRMGLRWVPYDPLLLAVYDTEEVLVPPSWRARWEQEGRPLGRPSGRRLGERNGAASRPERSGAAVRRAEGALTRPMR